MARHTQLNNIDHEGLKIRTGRSGALGDAVMWCPVFTHELRDVQARYPVVFRKEGGRFQPIALFGLEPGENLFLDGRGWDADFIPAALRAQPFLIGQRPRPGPDGRPELEIHVDLDHPRVSQTEGEPVFLEHGGMTELLKDAAKTLEGLAAGHEATAAFVQALADLGLLEPFTLEADLGEGDAARLTGMHVIAEERVSWLQSDDLGALHEAGHLQPLFMVMASLSHLSGLVARKRARLAGRGGA
ncbi:SapC family protein [Glycocaulis profundi]|nr:SapC family protein [Glycocaulis profundi]